MNYYKIVDKNLSDRMAEYWNQASAAEEAADALVSSIPHAGSFAPSPYGEFGGVSAIVFSKKRDVPGSFRFAGNFDGYDFYEPSVHISESVQTDLGIRGYELMEKSNHYYDVHEITHDQARAKMSYSHAIGLANLKWKGTNMVDLAASYRVSPVWLKIYAEGRMPFGMLCQKSKDDGLKFSQQAELDQKLESALKLEDLLAKAFKDRKFYWVKHVKGNRMAVAFYKNASALPLVPMGRLAELLCVKFVGEPMTPAFFRSGGIWYVGTSGTIDGNLLTPVSEMEYESAKLKRGDH